MTPHPSKTRSGAGTSRPAARSGRDKTAANAPRPRPPWRAAIVAVIVLIALGALYLTFQHGSRAGSPGGDAYQVGTPGVGAVAPGFTLPSTTGAPVSLDSFKGNTVLLYFHEGLGCQPCWDQIRDLDADASQLTAAGIDQLVTITSGQVDVIARKMADDKLTATALADTDLAVSRTYNANQFGMMGTDRDGHSFILVGPDGRIQWRADYGGAPKYTMYVPVAQLLTDLKAGRGGA